MASEIDQDVEDFRQRLDKVVRDASIETRAGFGIIEEIVEFDPIPTEIDVGVPQVIMRSGLRNPIVGACCSLDEFDLTICDDGLSEKACNDRGGEFFANTFCTSDPCAGACCEDDGSGGFNCEDLSKSDCDAVGGTFMGIDTACADDPDPCTPPTGACCFVDEPCTDLTEAECDSAGGGYQGDGTACTDSPDPCATGTCPSITLLCDSIFASRSKCGFPSFDGSPPVYLQLDEDCFSTETQSCCYRLSDGVLLFTCTALFDFHSTFSDTYHRSDCSHSAVGGNTIGIITDCDNGVRTTTGGCPDYSGIPVTGPTTRNAVTTHVDSTSSEGCKRQGGGDSCDPATVTTSFGANVSLSNEYTTAQLKADTIALLPNYFGHFGCDENVEIGFREPGQNCTCFASRSLSFDERFYSINRFKYIFTFAAASVAFDISWDEVFVPEGGGTGFSVHKSEHIAIGQTSSSVYTVNEPSTNGTVHIDNISCSVSS